MVHAAWKFVFLGVSVVAVSRDFGRGPVGVVSLALVFGMRTVEAVELLCSDVVFVFGGSVGLSLERVVCGVQVLPLGDRS